MTKYDHIVVGSGISGLSLTHLLGMNGYKVLLLEKGQHIGGSLLRFVRNGVPFDTGFHFTGGFSLNGILHNMLTVHGIHDYIHPVFISEPESNRFVFESMNETYDLPPGIDNLSCSLKKSFSHEINAIERYFELIQKVCMHTPSMNLHKISLSFEPLDEDYITLGDMLDRLTRDVLLKGILSGYCMCYGVKPKEISFANHARVVWGLYECVARVKEGGDAFIRAFTERFTKYDIEVRCNTSVDCCSDILDNQVQTFVLSDGEAVSADCCTYAIHPQQVLNSLPREQLTKAFCERINGFEPSIGFFSVFGVVDDGMSSDSFGPSIVSLWPLSDMDELLSSSYKGTQPLVILRNTEINSGREYKIITAFEPSFPEDVARWKNSRTGQRPKEYLEYKEERAHGIHKRIIGYYPEYKDSFKILDTASMLTFRDYLHSPEGCAYGIKQKIGQLNLFGKLPLTNIYVIGQSAVLPDIVGAMLSSFIVARSLIGKERYNRFLEERLSQ